MALARRRLGTVEFPYVWLFVALMTVAAVSVVNSWLFWDPNVGTSMERGSGHRWIGYQVTALYFLATPFLAFAAGAVYAQLERISSLYLGVVISVTATTVVGLWTWWHNPVNPIDVYLKGARPNINPDATLFLIALSSSVLVWQHRRWRLLRHSVGHGHLYQGTYKSFPVEKTSTSIPFAAMWSEIPSAPFRASGSRAPAAARSWS